MERNVSAAIEQHFGDLTDPRIDRTKLHKLIDILVIAICAVIVGADNWEDVEEFGKARTEWFQTRFLRWMSAVSTVIGGRVITINGKVLRRSQDQGIGKAAIDMVSAWATANRLVLGRV